MRFSQKIFLSIFLVSLALGSTLIWSARHIFAVREEAQFISRYRALSGVVGRSLMQLEANTELLMYAAGKALVETDAKEGLIPEGRLKQLRTELGVTHLFVIDQAGDFVRSTNEAPALIPNLYTFCGGYRSLLSSRQRFMSTPIIPSNPETSPFKFLVMPNASHTRFLEVGVRSDFIGKNLTEALREDSSILSLKLLTPDGNSLGDYQSSGVSFVKSRDVIPTDFSSIVRTDNGFKLFTKVDASEENCCECEISGHTRNGKYFYTIETVVSNKALTAALAEMNHIFLWVQLAVALGAYLAASLLSKKLVYRIAIVAENVEGIDRLGQERRRVTIEGNDEISFLSKRFDQLLDHLAVAQNELVTSQKKAAVSEIAREVSHNIRSPISSLEGLLKRMKNLTDNERSIFRSSLREVKDLADKLHGQVIVKNHQPTGGAIALCLSQTISAPSGGKSITTCEILSMLEHELEIKEAQYISISQVTWSFSGISESYGLFAAIQQSDFAAIISNIIDNAVDSFKGRPGQIAIKVSSTEKLINISVSDTGHGIPPEILSRLGREELSFGKKGSGIGLIHATKSLQSWGGSLEIQSEKEIGTEVVITLPKAQPPAWFAPELDLRTITQVVIVDDNESIHYLWRLRLDLAQFDGNVRSFLRAEDFLAWIKLQVALGLSGTVALIDYEFREEETDGLGLIEALQHEVPSMRALLVTGCFDDEAILSRATWIGVNLVPKPLVKSIPVRLEFRSEIVSG